VRCPYCQQTDDKVVDSRTADDGAAIRRRRECLVCGRRYTTYERVEDMPLMVVKRSGASEPFNRTKLVTGIRHAVTGRPIDAATVEAMAATIEEELRAQGPDVSSDVVGRAVLDRLRQLDDVAYLRFASVYKGFEDLADFQREVGELQELGLRKLTDPKPPAAD
jgi:transcriptional repressor NrdR